MPIAKRSEAARFLFESSALDKEALFPVRFRGYEEISRPYRFEIDLVSDDPHIDLAAVTGQPATLHLQRIGDGFEHFRPIHGIVVDFQLLQSQEGYAAYRAELVPRLWLASLAHRSRIFKDMTVPEIVREVLAPYDVKPEFSLAESYPPREYCVQYRESDLNFVSRLLEFEGLSYFFRHEEGSEVLLISDKPDAFAPIEVQEEIPFHQGYRVPRELNEKVEELVCRERLVSSHVILQDYNYRTPDTDLRAETRPDGQPEAVYYEYGDHYKDPGAGKRLARVRHEEIACQRRVLHGRSTCAGMQAGYTFTLKGHTRDDLNQEFLLLRVEHEGRQFGFMGKEYETFFSDTPDAGTGPRISYGNTFRCIPASIPFRPPRLTPKPRVHGVMTATVIGDGGGYAALDEHGRYWAQMHFDLENKGSRPIRMVQPYTGKGHAGFHLPPHPGTEMLWACIDGDPDRPYAIGSGPNPNNPAPVTSENNSQHIFRTTSDNLLFIEDRQEMERITLYTPRFNSLLSLGDKHAGNEGCTLTTEEKTLIHGGKGIGLHAPKDGLFISAWPAFGDGNIGTQINAALPLATAIIGAATGKFIDSADSPFGKVVRMVKKANDLWSKASLAAKAQKFFGEENIYTKFFDQFGTPGIFATAQGGIDFVNAEGFTIVTGGGYTLLTPAEVKLMAADDIGLSSGASVSVYARHGHIQMVADTKDILMKAVTSNVVSRAKKGIVHSAGSSIYLRAGDVTDDLKRKTLGSIGKDIVGKFKKKEPEKKVEYELPPTDGDCRIQLNAKDGIYLNAENGEVIIQSQQKEIALAGDKLALAGENGVEIYDDKKQIELTCGQASIILKKSGEITIKGMKITIEADQTLTLKGGMAVNVNTDGKVTTQGNMVESNGKAVHIVKGGIVKIN
ncbi:type VI secretion system tip protein VgrG [Rhodocaloribacter litoris]|uniref:type VI secretion system tip protein TssI/VgrG n=1 Tax=Rhodocaloribacter litoris TaxID=2558931 RepID=UPI00142415E8|nr:type VI secretion system tip protein TssI/VgrG [Rhodocaloribacter litoris]QXD13878.1 type VI secretion system tip protein VgrG [Rhodocaloribacter litoris]